MSNIAINLKQCPNKTCLKWYPATTEYFYKQKESKDGLSSWCKQCKRDYQNKYRELNRETVLVKKREWRVKNKDLVNERAKQWKIDNAELWKQYYKEWQNSEIGKKKLKQHSIYRNQHKKHEISKQEWVECEKFFNYECVYCGLPEVIHKELYNQQLHKDHYYNTGSNKIDNCVPACKVCNSKKHDSDGDIWFNEANEHFKPERKEKIVQWIKLKSK